MNAAISSAETSAAQCLLHAGLQRLRSQSAVCKVSAVIIGSVVLLMAAGRTGAEVLVWAMAPVLLLAFADGVYYSQAIRLATLAEGRELSAAEVFAALRCGRGFSNAARLLTGLSSFSVWPFYGSLAAIVLILGHTVLIPQNQPPSSRAAQFAEGKTYTAPLQPAGSIQGGGNKKSSISGSPGYPPAQNSSAPSSSANDPNTVSRANLPPMGAPLPKPKTTPASAPVSRVPAGPPAPRTTKIVPKPRNQSPPAPVQGGETPLKN